MNRPHQMATPLATRTAPTVQLVNHPALNNTGLWALCIANQAESMPAGLKPAESAPSSSGISRAAGPASSHSLSVSVCSVCGHDAVITQASSATLWRPRCRDLAGCQPLATARRMCFWHCNCGHTSSLPYLATVRRSRFSLLQGTHLEPGAPDIAIHCHTQQNQKERKRNTQPNDAVRLSQRRKKHTGGATTRVHLTAEAEGRLQASKGFPHAIIWQFAGKNGWNFWLKVQDLQNWA